MDIKELTDYSRIISDSFKLIDDKEKLEPNYYTKLTLDSLNDKLLYELGILFKKSCDKPHDKLLSDIEKERQYRKIIVLCMIIVRRIRE
jgi:hypothetical protein